MSKTLALSSDSWSHIQQKVIKTTHTWIIDDAKERFGNINSTNYNEFELSEYKLDILLKLKVDQSLNAVIDIGKKEKRRTESWSLKVFSLNNKKNEIFNVKQSQVFIGEFYTNPFLLFKIKDLIDGKLDHLMFEDKLVIFCELTYQTEYELKGRSKLVIDNDSREQINVPPCNIVDDYRSLLEDKEHSDVTICVNGKEYQAHRAILAARSSKFKAMFRSNMRESLEGRVELNNIEEDVFKEFLDYIYTGKSILQEKPDYLLAINLIRTADEYQLDHLKSICEKVLYNSVSEENAIEILSTANLFRLSQLEERLRVFVFDHINEITQMIDWKKLTKENPSLVCELLTKFTSHKLQTDLQVKN